MKEIYIFLGVILIKFKSKYKLIGVNNLLHYNIDICLHNIKVRRQKKSPFF